MDSTPAGTPAALRRSNVAHLLRTIRQHGPVSRSALARLSELSKPTVQAAVDDLLRSDLVIESAENGTAPKAKPGPTPRLLRFNADHALVIGVDVGAAKMLAVLSNLDGESLAACRCATPPGATGRRLDQTIKTLVDKCFAEAGVGRGRLSAAAVGTTGVVDRESGSVTFAPQLPGWQGRAVRPSLEAALRVPVLLESEAHLAMLGESWRGVAINARDAVLIQFGVGVGMGVLIGGEIYRGAMGAAGEIGYLPIGETPPQVNQGPGPFETAVGSMAFTLHKPRPAQSRRSRNGHADASRSLLDDLGPAQIFARASGGDTAALAVLTDILNHLSSGLVAVAAVLNPELIVLGGGLAPSLAPYLHELQHQLVTRVPAPPRLELSSLGDRAVAIGAVKRAVSFAEEGVFSAITLGS
jgi:predicted NBD/HSP70 family sugar kinase